MSRLRIVKKHLNDLMVIDFVLVNAYHLSLINVSTSITVYVTCLYIAVLNTPNSTSCCARRLKRSACCSCKSSNFRR